MIKLMTKGGVIMSCSGCKYLKKMIKSMVLVEDASIIVLKQRLMFAGIMMFVLLTRKIMVEVVMNAIEFMRMVKVILILRIRDFI